MTDYGTEIIAEVGSTHEGNFSRMLAMIAEAADQGANTVKFQWVSSANRLADRRQAHGYTSSYRFIQFDPSWLPRLAGACVAHGVKFLCTVYLPEDVVLVNPHVSEFKVSSFEVEDMELIQQLERTGKPLVVSTGMMTIEEVVRVRHEFSRELMKRTRWLHCVSAYPCPVEALQLRVMETGIYDGVSDHTTSLISGAVAVGKGATVIEKHVRSSYCSANNADFTVSLDFDDFETYVENIRNAEKLIGDRDSTRMIIEEERELRQYKIHSKPSV